MSISFISETGPFIWILFFSSRKIDNFPSSNSISVIFFVESIDNFNIKKVGPAIENNKLFPKKCNVTIAEVINQNLIKVKVWERGAGQTKACGTAACATAVAGNINGLTKTSTDIEFELGKLSIFLDEKNIIYMEGPVSEIKEIDIKL